MCPKAGNWSHTLHEPPPGSSGLQKQAGPRKSAGSQPTLPPSLTCQYGHQITIYSRGIPQGAPPSKRMTILFLWGHVEGKRGEGRKSSPRLSSNSRADTYPEGGRVHRHEMPLCVHMSAEPAQGLMSAGRSQALPRTPEPPGQPATFPGVGRRRHACGRLHLPAT